MRALAVTAAIAALLACAACDACGNYGPSTIREVPGTVVAYVVDDDGRPIENVWVYVHDIPNPGGSPISRGRATNTMGIAEIQVVPAGSRRVEVSRLTGYAIAEAIVPVTVLAGVSVQVTFTLTKNSA